MFSDREKIAYLQNAAGKVVVIVDTAIALATLCHELAVEARVRHRWLRVVGVVTVCAIESLGLLLAGPPEEEGSAGHSSRTNDTNHRTSRDGSLVGAALLFTTRVGIGGIGGGRHNLGLTSRISGRGGRGCSRGRRGGRGDLIIVHAGRIHRVVTTSTTCDSQYRPSYPSETKRKAENIHISLGHPLHSVSHLLSSTLSDDGGSDIPHRHSLPLVKPKTR